MIYIYHNNTFAEKHVTACLAGSDCVLFLVPTFGETARLVHSDVSGALDMVGFSWATGQADICTAEACEFFLEGMFLHAWLRCPFLTFGAGHNCMQRRAQHMYYISDVLCKYRRGAREINEIDGCHQRKRLSKKLHGSFRKSVPSAEAMPRDLVPSSRSATVSARTM